MKGFDELRLALAKTQDSAEIVCHDCIAACTHESIFKYVGNHWR